MEKFARIIIGYHGCRKDFADAILLGTAPIAEWKKSENKYDWLGSGVYFWEHSLSRAQRWAEENYADNPAVIGAVIQLGNCFDLLQEEQALLLRQFFPRFAEGYRARGQEIPVNQGTAKKLRNLDCAVINRCLKQMAKQDIEFDTVRGAFLEGEPLFEGTTLSAETHIQIAVRNTDSILGVFKPNV